MTDGEVQIDVAVNAPEAGKITELLAKEEDTVTVGQDLAKIEVGAEGEGGKKEASEEPKQPASSEQETSSQPSGEKEAEIPKKEESKQPEPKKESAPAPSPPPQQKKPEPKKEAKTEAPKDDVKKIGGFGSREERRVWSVSPAFHTTTTNSDHRSR
jgi:2-oxoglutarate dehydrogenase E2 component (dihydrolipoamide succinyltransferase)